MKKVILNIICIFLASCNMFEQSESEKQREHIDSLSALLTDKICIEKAHNIIFKYTGTDFHECNVDKNYFMDDDFSVICEGVFEYNINGINGEKIFSIEYIINALDFNYQLCKCNIKDKLTHKKICEYNPKEDKLLSPKWEIGDEFNIGSTKLKLVNIHGKCQSFETSQIMNNEQIMKVIDHFQRDKNYDFVNFYLTGMYDGSNENYYKRWQSWSEKESVIFDIKTGNSFSVQGSKESHKFVKIKI